MVWPWSEVVIHEDAVAQVTRSPLQGQRDQVREAALWHRVLVREEAIVRVQTDVRSALHGLGEQVGTEPARQRCGNGALEEQPDMPSPPRTRAFESGAQAQTPTALHERHRIGLPAGLVEVDSQEVAGLIHEERVHSSDEWLPTVVSPGEMPTNEVVGYRQEAAMRAHRALDPRLFADAPHPLIRAGRRVAGPTGLPALEPSGVDAFAPSEQRSEEGNLGRRWRMPAEYMSGNVRQRRLRLATRHRHPACDDLAPGGQTGRLTRTFLGVAVTRQPDHVSTASARNRFATLSCRAMRPGCGSRTSSRPW